MRTIDIHAHISPEGYINAVAKGESWHGMPAEPRVAGDYLSILGSNPKTTWTPEERLADMNSLGVDVQVLYRPFQLDPTIPEAGIPYKEYMSQKFGGVGDAEKDASKDRFSQMRAALEQYGENEGIPFRFSGIEMRPNTVNAHRIVRWAQGQGKGWAAKELLFNAYFNEHRDIGDKDVLADIAAELGLDRALIADLLKGQADIQETLQEEIYFRQMGFSGVPTFVANRKVAAQGAEDTHKLVRFIRTAAKEYPLDASIIENA